MQVICDLKLEVLEIFLEYLAVGPGEPIRKNEEGTRMKEDFELNSGSSIVLGDPSSSFALGLIVQPQNPERESCRITKTRRHSIKCFRDMPRRGLNHPDQIERWLTEMGDTLKADGELTLIGSGALLWHAFQQGLTQPLPENSMDADPITESEEVAEMCYDRLIGSEFEMKEGWHVNLMPKSVLKEFPEDWEKRSTTKKYRRLTVTVPSVADLMIPKRKRGEPRDKKHEEYASALQQTTTIFKEGNPKPTKNEHSDTPPNP